jgi:hypothetical protein
MFEIDHRYFMKDGYEMSIVVVPCCGYSSKQNVVVSFSFNLETCVCKYLHTLLVSEHFVG